MPGGMIAFDKYVANFRCVTTHGRNGGFWGPPGKVVADFDPIEELTMKSSGRTTGGLSALFAAVILVIGMDALPALGQDMPQRQASPSTTWTPPPPPKITAKQPKPKVVKPATAPAAPRTVAPKPLAASVPSVIIDTDMFGSADDAGALAIANALQDNGKIKIIGVVVNDASRWGAPTASAINTYYNHAGIPVGAIKPVDDTLPSGNTYAKYVATHFPNQLNNDGANAPDATTLYRQLLSGASGKVTIVGIGLETNLQNLMNSPAGADGVAQSGMQLITSKVESLTMMGGQFPDSHAAGPEYNWAADASAATQVVNSWPTSVPATFEGYEVGASVTTGAGLAQTPDANPVKAAYTQAIGAGNSMSSWDSIAMYYAGMGLDGLFTNSQAGSVVVDSVGGDTWSSTAKAGQHYLVKSASDSAIATKLEALLDQQPGGSPPSDPIAAKYNSMGGSSSFLGNPVGAEKTPTADGKEQDYQNGAIYWTTATGAHVVHGAFLAKYRQLGGPAGTLGYPAMDEAAVGDKVGEWIKFSRSSGARLYWTSQIGAHAVYGAILAEYLRFGGPTSTLGYPITDESAAVGGRYNHFSRAGGASIYWSSGTGAHAIYGAIRSRWASLGWERSRLGFPTTNEYGYPGGRRNEFQHGTISWTRASGAITVHYW